MCKCFLDIWQIIPKIFQAYLLKLLTYVIPPTLFFIFTIGLGTLLKVNNIGEFQAPITIRITVPIYTLYIFLCFCYIIIHQNSNENISSAFFKYIKHISDIFSGVLIGMIISTILANHLTNTESTLWFYLIVMLLLDFIVLLAPFTDEKECKWYMGVRRVIFCIGFCSISYIIEAGQLITIISRNIPSLISSIL